jgi:hypothetical protein
MSTVDQIIQSLPALSEAEKALLRDALDRELGRSQANGSEAPNPLFGLMADETELVDRIVDEAYALRALPLRYPANG